MVDLQKRIAQAKILKDNTHPTDELYQALMREYMPGTKLPDVEASFSRLEEKLKDILPWILDEQAKRPDPVPLIGPFPAVSKCGLIDPC